jgi:hypothetical protein
MDSIAESMTKFSRLSENLIVLQFFERKLVQVLPARLAIRERGFVCQDSDEFIVGTEQR